MKAIRRKKIKTMMGLLTTLMLLLATLLPANASISPTSLTATLAPGQSIVEAKTVNIPALPPKVDVMFSFDLTGSMGDTLSSAKARAGELMTKLDTLGIDINYGVASYMDYPEYYSSFGYSSNYGEAGVDYPYKLGQGITSDRVAVTGAINSLTLGFGNDVPEDYTRAFYESYADSSVNWRTGAKRILVNFADSVPHDNNLNEGVTTGTWSTGGDPGRDGVMGTADDLDLQQVLAQMKINNVILLEAHDYSDEYWDYWTRLTGGGNYVIGSATFVDDLASAITATVTTASVSNLHLQASPGYESWIESVTPVFYTGPTGVDVNFSLKIKVPEGTKDGTYKFTVSAVDGSAVSYGEQSVTITVPAAASTATMAYGGGSIVSPKGAYAANPDLAGNATYGISAVLSKTSSIPTGKTQFYFKDANLQFMYKSYESMTISGANARYQGSGTVNGAGNYGFMVSVIDGQAVGGGGQDKFRIKIWDKTNGAVIYDTQPGDSNDAVPVTPVGSTSSIVIK